MRRLLRFDLLFPLILLAGMAQYGGVAFDALSSGRVSLWQLESDAINSAGPLRYVKDLLIVVLSLVWPVVLPKLGFARNMSNLITIYFCWVTGVVVIGSLGFLFGYSPLFFLPAGLRWILLLHAAFGVFILSFTLVKEPHRHPFIFKFLLLILSVEAYVVVLQFNTTSDLLGLAFGAARLTGLFGNAGVAAFYAIAVALTSFQLDGVALKKRIGVTLVCVFLALSSGTRFATAAIFLLLLIQLWEMADANKSKLKNLIKLMFVPLFFVALIVGYQALNQQVGRGDALTQQLGEGGRVGVFFESMDILLSGEPGEVLVGRGLGIGTNTAIGGLLAEGIDPLTYRFNRLADNALITGIFQFGVLGSLLFWMGIVKLILFVRPKYSVYAKHRYFGIVAVIMLTLLAGSPFEHYFLMMSYAASLGAVYWSDKLAFQELKLARS